MPVKAPPDHPLCNQPGGNIIWSLPRAKLAQHVASVRKVLIVFVCKSDNSPRDGIKKGCAHESVRTF